ncbi:mediator of RNA polymerase II transcription subunit 13-like isoform X3 [Glycine soja]|uniref:mediator of RNA polymerase II transcription subunit 13 isoform X3 n=1 Tax=Glycine max TaxID=3847 RepID=UPI0007192755|nr:mediator of RNA polymerase II transcription subunit 13 isoform X3 [Glycine max]XP_028213915.1 mediator of RNA polymerase II transcription subunit 13-like isoform X3 [Glycine soja]|eukprot:XP_014626292.1 mediator of RNA polymerase II transcription subunit 13 isoform X3 [Glycine max]
MWTNVFKIGSMHQISWFQFLPHEPDLNPLPDKSVKVDQKDAAMLLVLSSHLQLQKEGFLSTWTNSFVGPWDPSQGLHNPDEKIKLWLFLRGRHSSVVETAQTAVSGLRVVASGLWLAPGDSEEVAAALSQALRNCIERALLGLYYMRFGDVFSKFHQFQREEIFRGQPAVEFVFAATEEAIFIHVIVSSKHIRMLSTADLEKVLKHSMESTYRLPVIVSPHGIRGSLTGCSPSDLVKQSYFSSSTKFRVSNGIIGLPYHVSQGVGCQLRGQNCYVEVSLGFPRSGTDNTLQPNKNSVRNLPKLHVAESPVVGRSDHKGPPDHLLDYDKTFLYPAEAVLVPVLQTSLARSSLRRFWLQNWMGPSLPGSSSFIHCAGNVDCTEDPWTEINGTRTQSSYDSSSNSNNSSISSLSASSSDSDYKTTGPSELEADADSLTCRQSMVSSADQLDSDGPKLGSKRSRTGVTELLSTATNIPVQDAYMSDFGSMEVNNSAITGVGNEPIGSYWDWDDDDRGMEMDIQALLSEFGDFGDFFENDVLPFGEPPGTAESQALMLSAPDCGDVNSSPGGVIDVPDQILLPVGFASFESFNPPPSTSIEECLNKSQDNLNNSMSLGPTNQNQLLYTREFDHIMKAEAMMTFAPEFGAVDTPTCEFSTTLFRSPYFPKSRKAKSSTSSSSNYLYGAAPPTSTCTEGSEGKNGKSVNTKTGSGKHDASTMSLHSKYYYTFVESRKEKNDKNPATCNDNSITKSEGMPPLSNIGSNAIVKSAIRKTTDCTHEAEQFLLSAKTLLATDITCIMLQASMCRLRHILLSSGNLMPAGLSRSTGVSFLNQLPSDPSMTTDNISGKYDVKKKENIPIRIAGDIDGGMLDGHLNAPVGVWRTLGASKVVKPSNSPNMEVVPSFPHNSFNEEGILSYGQRKPLQELLDGIALLVQQAISFVDLALDVDCGDGPYGLLAMQEQWRRGFCCGPSMVHAGCGGSLASSHSLDIAGLELVDPLSADVHASTVISLLQSDIKTALKSAFPNLEGPLSVTDWCKGRNQLIDTGSVVDGVSAESNINECRDSSEPMSPSQSSVGGSSSIKVSNMMDKVDETSQRRSGQDLCSTESEQQTCSRLKPTLIALPFPSILVGYQDDWLKTSANSLQHWEKAPLEPYALQKPITYHVVCPDIDPLTSAAADFFQQLGTVYETCKLGTHSPQGLGNQIEIESAKLSSCGFVLLDCPQSMKIESSNASLVGSVSDYFLSLSNGWDLTSYLKSLSKALRGLKIGSCFSTNPSEGSNSSCLVIYVVCPFPDPTAILQTVIESSVAIGSVVQQSDRERRSSLHSQVVKALSGLATVDEASASNILVLSGFSIPKLVLQIVTVDAIFRVTSPSVSELVILKETSFTVYSKARRISRGISSDFAQSAFSSRSHSGLTQMPSPISGMWKDCVGPRMAGHSLPREGDIDASLRPGTWDNSWQPTRTGGLSCDPSRTGDNFLHDEIRYMFEPLFILAEPGSLENGISVIGSPTSESSKALADDSSGNYVQSTSTAGSVESASSTDASGSDPKTPPSLHCCYGWTEDWRWLVCIWTDSRGELLDCNIFPFGGISSRQDTKGLQCLFVQILQQGCLILQSCDPGLAKPRDFVIARIGGFYELEYLEWQKAIYSVGVSEMKRWPLQLRKSMSDGMSATSNGSSLQQSDMSLIPERTLPSSPSPLYSPHTKSPGFMKGSLGQPTARKQLIGGHSMVDNSRGLLHWAQSISFVAVSMDHTLQLVLPADSSTPGYIEGFTPVKSLGSTSSAYILIPSPSMRFLPTTVLQLPTCLTAESPPLAHLLHSKGSALPLSTGFVVSKAVPSMRKDYRANQKEEWPSVLSVSLIDYYGGTNIPQEKIVRGINKQGGRSLSWEAKDFEIETHLVLESLAAELHALSWMTVSPTYLERRTALPFHCDMVLRLRRLLHFADKELSKQSEKS